MHTTFSLLVPIQFRCSPVLYMIVDTATYQENELSTLTTVVQWIILSSLHIVHLKWMNRETIFWSSSFLCLFCLLAITVSITWRTKMGEYRTSATPSASICPGPNKWECSYVDGAESLESFVWKNPFTTANPKTGQYVALILSWTNCGGLNDTSRLPVGHQFHELHIFMMAQECAQVERRSITTSSRTK